MSDYYYSLFDTSLGRCGIAWGDKGLVSASFAEESDTQTATSLRRRAVGAVEARPTGENKSLIDGVIALLAGEKPVFKNTSIDYAGIADFDRDVMKLTLAIPAGETKTYGDLAKALGDVVLSRRVGQALGRNPIPIIVPCHRVVGADGAMTGFSAPGGTDVKRRLLKIEGALEPGLFD